MTDTQSNTAGMIRSYVERVERLHEERKALGDDVRDVFVEAKGNGFDVPALKAVIQRRAKRAKDASAFEAHNEIIDLYEAAFRGES